MSHDLPEKIRQQIHRAGLPTSGDVPFVPKLSTNRQGDKIISRQAVEHGPKQGKKGYVDDQDRIWVKDYAHGDVPDHWDVQIDQGKDYFRVDGDGGRI